MKLPRDLSGRDFVRLAQCLGYEFVRQESSHIRLVSNFMGHPHRVTVPDHSELSIGTLRSLIREIADYLKTEPAEVMRRLFQ